MNTQMLAQPMGQFYHSAGVLGLHYPRQEHTITLIVDGRAAWMRWLPPHEALPSLRLDATSSK